jgi:hypothetical protein
MPVEHFVVCDGCGTREEINGEDLPKEWWSLATDNESAKELKIDHDERSYGPYTFCSLDCVTKFVQRQDRDDRLRA